MTFTLYFKCLYTLNYLNLYSCFSFSFFLKYVKCRAFIKLNCHHQFCLYGNSVFHCSKHLLFVSHLGFLIGRRAYTNMEKLPLFFCLVKLVPMYDCLNVILGKSVLKTCYLLVIKTFLLLTS